MSCVIIVQARMTSTRLPGKVLMPVLGKPLLAYELERLQRCQQADALMVATTINASDDPVVALCQELNVPVFRGSEQDVLSRYHGAAQQIKAETVVRVTADCPLIDPAVVDAVIAHFKAAQKGTQSVLDYASNTLVRSYPRGLDVEVFSRSALEIAHQEAMEPAHREHVTPFFYQNPQRFRLASLEAPKNWGHHRWTVDTPEDFELARRILEALYPIKPNFACRDVLALLEQHPEWVALNAHIEQVKV
ncbi:glycosyltransferase family protein [Vampirovibrio chlorellavorus]|uniref:glycosyltransferase family protein n=1 Tax=Vampirovibrio chlorellavorus TaxID=758823 RepID=UPI0026F0E48E|nr:glycosyltransferase family protein [Vampirovibrio chlorellavorus]